MDDYRARTNVSLRMCPEWGVKAGRPPLGGKHYSVVKKCISREGVPAILRRHSDSIHSHSISASCEPAFTRAEFRISRI